MAGSRLGAVPFRAALIFYAISVSAAYGQSQTNVQFDQTGDPAIRTEAGWAALGTRNYDRAREDFIVALRSDPNFFEARRGLARTEAAQGRYREALSLIEPLRAVSPSFMLDQAVLLLLDDQPDQALAVIDGARDWAQSRASKRDGGRVRPDFTKALHMLRGDVLYRMGGYDAALDEFEAANEVIEGADAWRAIGDSHDALGALNVAKEAYTRALELRRFDGTAYQRRARARYLSGDVSGALKDYAEAQVGLDESVGLLSEMAETFMAAGSYGDAISVLNRLLSKVQGDPAREKPVRWHLASALVQAGRPRAAEKQLALIEPWDGYDVPMLFMRGRANFAMGDFARSRAYFTEALRLRRGDPRLLYNRGLATLREGHIERALDDFGEGLKRAPQSSEIRNAIGIVKLYQGNYEDGMLLYDAGVARNPSNPRPLIQRSRAHRSIGEPKEALADAEDALRLDPASSDAAVAAAHALLDLERPQRAFEYADRLIKSQARQREGYVLQARGLIQTGATNDALSALEQARNFGAPEGELALLEGNAYLTAGNHRDALVAYNRALNVAPESIKLREQRGDALVALGELDAAADDYASALALAAPASAPIGLRMKRAEALRRNDDCARAVTEYDLILAELPDDTPALRGRGKCKMADGAFVDGLRDMVGSFF